MSRTQPLNVISVISGVRKTNALMTGKLLKIIFLFYLREVIKQDPMNIVEGYLSVKGASLTATAHCSFHRLKETLPLSVDSGSVLPV